MAEHRGAPVGPCTEPDQIQPTEPTAPTGRISITVRDYGMAELNAIAVASEALKLLPERARHRAMNWLISKYLGEEALAAVDAVLPRDRARGEG